MTSRKGRFRRAKWGCALTVVAIVALVWSMRGVYGVMHLLDGRNPWRYVEPTPERRMVTIANAEVIIAALEQWKAKRGEYPGSLDDLVPSELPSIPPSVIGDRTWNYSRPTPGRFVLDFFEGSIYEHSWWDSDKKEWGVDLTRAARVCRRREDTEGGSNDRRSEQTAVGVQRDGQPAGAGGGRGLGTGAVGGSGRRGLRRAARGCSRESPRRYRGRG